MRPDLRPERGPLVGTLSLLLALTLAALVARCGVARCAEPEPDSVGLRAGAPAPYTGVLTPPGAYRVLLRLGDDLDAEREGRKLDAEQHKADVDALTAKLAAVEAARRACEQDKAPAPKPRRRPWYEEPLFLVGSGVALGIGATVAIVEAAR